MMMRIWITGVFLAFTAATLNAQTQSRADIERQLAAKKAELRRMSDKLAELRSARTFDTAVLKEREAQIREAAALYNEFFDQLQAFQDKRDVALDNYQHRFRFEVFMPADLDPQGELRRNWAMWRAARGHLVGTKEETWTDWFERKLRDAALPAAPDETIFQVFTGFVVGDELREAEQELLDAQQAMDAELQRLNGLMALSQRVAILVGVRPHSFDEFSAAIDQMRDEYQAARDDLSFAAELIAEYEREIPNIKREIDLLEAALRDATRRESRPP